MTGQLMVTLLGTASKQVYRVLRMERRTETSATATDTKSQLVPRRTQVSDYRLCLFDLRAKRAMIDATDHRS